MGQPRRHTIRCLRQVANENEINYPEASNTIKNDFYVDDCLTGSDSSKKLLKLQRELTTILSNSGFELHKWLSNDKELFEKFQVNCNLECSTLPIG